MPYELASDRPLSEARAYVAEHMDKGVHCPCCGQYAKVYRRNINHQMAMGLIALAKHGQGFHHLPTVEPTVRGGDTTKCAYWGLLNEELVIRPDGGRAGYWELTDQGRRFVMGFVTVPKYAMVYNKQVLELTGPPWSIHDALGTPFDLQDLL